jgi:hypothetical protein
MARPGRRRSTGERWRFRRSLIPGGPFHGTGQGRLFSCQRFAGWASKDGLGARHYWHQELVGGPELQPVLHSQSPPTRRRSAAGAKVPQHRMSRPSRTKGRTRTHLERPAQHVDAWACSSSSSSTAPRSSRATSFYYSAVSPDHQAGTGVPPHNPGLRPNFQVQHLLCPACGLTLPQVGR